MTKYAQLPNGKRLAFPDETSEDTIRRTVRGQLGLNKPAVEKIIEAISELPLRPIENSINSLVDSNRRLTEEIQETLMAQASRINTAVAKMEASNKEASMATQKMIREMATIVMGVKEAIAELQRTGASSLKMTTQNTIEAAQVANLVDASAERIGRAAKEITAAMDKFVSVYTLPKKCERNRDGTWTMEIDYGRRL